MRAGIEVNVTPEDRRRLEAIVADRSAPQKHVWRARIILATADGCGTAEIMRRSGKAKPVVWTWQARFMAKGVDGLVRDKTRKPGKKPLPPDTARRVVDLALGPPPREGTHWTGRLLAKAAGVSLRSVQRILQAHQLAPHRVRTFKLSKDPKFSEKLKDIVGLYVDPPAHAVVLSVDEKSQIQALDRTQPGLPMKRGRAGTMTHDYKRHGTTTLFAALNVLDGTIIGRNMQRHRHQEFIRFLNAVEAQVSAGKAIHAIVDNFATHKHPKVRSWLARHPRWTFHFTPTSASWLNAVECFFIEIARPNQVWAMDITYIPMARGFVYLAVVLDWFSRRVLSWRLSITMDAAFCIEALEDAMARHGKPEIFNTDSQRIGAGSRAA